MKCLIAVACAAVAQAAQCKREEVLTIYSYLNQEEIESSSGLFQSGYSSAAAAIDALRSRFESWSTLIATKLDCWTCIETHLRGIFALFSTNGVCRSSSLATACKDQLSLLATREYDCVERTAEARCSKVDADFLDSVAKNAYAFAATNSGCTRTDSDCFATAFSDNFVANAGSRISLSCVMIFYARENWRWADGGVIGPENQAEVDFYYRYLVEGGGTTSSARSALYTMALGVSLFVLLNIA